VSQLVQQVCCGCIALTFPSQPNPDKNSNEPYVEFFDHLLKLEDSKLPHTLTTSYGEDEQSVPRAYAEKVCQMIAQLGARGVSVIFASGELVSMFPLS